MARILNAESQRQITQGAKPFSRREKPTPPRDRPYLVVGGYEKHADGSYTYITPTKLCKRHGIDPEKALVYHPGTKEPEPHLAPGMTRVDINGKHAPHEAE